MTRDILGMTNNAHDAYRSTCLLIRVAFMLLRFESLAEIEYIDVRQFVERRYEEST